MIEIDEHFQLPDNQADDLPFEGLVNVEQSSFFVPDYTPEELRVASNRWKKKNRPGWKFQVVAENGGSRIWRVK